MYRCWPAKSSTRLRRPARRPSDSAASVVVKAQVKAGGRGKAGGVKLAETPDEAVGQGRRDILGMDIKGHTVHKVMIAADRRHRGGVLLLLPARPRQPHLPRHAPASRAAWRSRRSRDENPEAARQDPDRRQRRRRRGEGRARSSPPAKFPAEVADQVADVLSKLWDVFVEEDALLVEVNPLAKIGDGTVVALDGKVSLDENADFRHPDHEALEDKAAADPLEAAAKAKDLNYVKLDGEVGIIGNGAGLVMSHPRRRRVRR